MCAAFIAHRFMADCGRVVVALLGSAVLWAQVPEVRAAPLTMANTDLVALPHSSNGRDYLLYIALPGSYANSPTRTYPVIYACDPYWDFTLLMASHGNCVYDRSVPECIIVGIGYAGTNPDVGALRQLDYTPGVEPAIDPTGTTSGQAVAFLDVIAGQIIPYVESHFRVDPGYRVLVGSSYGGLFTLFAAVERPGMFQGIVAASPAAYWRTQYVLGRYRAAAAAGTRIATRIFVSYAAAESVPITGSTRDFALEVPRLGIPGLVLAAREIDGERHSSTKPEAYNRGLRFVLDVRAPWPSGPLGAGFGSPATLVNLSTRGRVAPGESALIGGIVVDGLVAKRLLIRAVGPGLAPHGVAEPLANPRFTVIDNAHHVVAADDDWSAGGGAFEVSQAASEAGAFALTAGSRDAAAILTLPPGVYTIVVDSVDGSSGIALVEAYELIQ
jgi:predicted alpha/beta superfamily hydrolase